MAETRSPHHYEDIAYADRESTNGASTIRASIPHAHAETVNRDTHALTHTTLHTCTSTRSDPGGHGGNDRPSFARFGTGRRSYAMGRLFSRWSIKTNE